MKKRILAAVMVAVMTLTGAACGDANFDLIVGGKAQEVNGNIKVNYELGKLIKIGKYKGIKLDAPKKVEIDDSQVIARAAGEAGRFKSTTTDKNVVVNNGDIVNIDFKGYVDGAKKPTAGTTAEKYDLGLGSNSFIPGFEEKIVGHKVGDKFDIDVTFPEDYQAEDMAGKPAVFKVKINGVITDKDVAASTDYKTVTEWMDAIKKDMTEEKEKQNKEELKSKTLETVLKFSQVRKFPDALVNQYKEDLIKYLYEPYAQMYGVSLDELKEQMNITDESILQNAQSNLAADMAMVAIADKANIQVTAEEFNKKKESLIGKDKAYKDEKEYEEQGGGDEAVVHNILFDKVENYLLENAVIVEKDDKNKDNKADDNSDDTDAGDLDITTTDEDEE